MTEEDDPRSERVQLNNCRYTPLIQEVEKGEERRAADYQARQIRPIHQEAAIAKKRLQQVRDSNEDELEKED